MADYLSLKELVKAIEENVTQLESGTLTLSELESHVNLVRELHEKTLILRYKAFEQQTTVPVKQTAPTQETLSDDVQEELPQHTNVNEYVTEKVEPIVQETEETTVSTPEIEFDFFSGSNLFVTETENSATESHSVPQEHFTQSTNQESEELSPSIVEKLDAVIDTPTIESVDEPVILEEIPARVEVEHQVEEYETATHAPGSNALIIEKVNKTQFEIRNQLGFQAIPSLIGSFGLNERLLYINELFDGSSESFSDAIKQLDSKASLSDAATFASELGYKFNWNIESDTVEEFIQKLCRRYA